MNLNDDEKKPSKLKQDLDKGSTTVAGEFRQVKKATRKTAVGKAAQFQSEKQRQKDEAILKANMKKKEDQQDGDSDWESVEEDAPVIQLQDLLDNMKINDEGENDDDDEDEEESKEDDE